jgi:hypothetical protein
VESVKTLRPFRPHRKSSWTPVYDAPALQLPAPLLLRSARLPTSGDYSFEPTDLEGLPDGLAVDGELVAFGDDGLPSFPRLCDRMLGPGTTTPTAPIL